MKHTIDDTLYSVINIIPNPVMITSEDELMDANNAFLKFFAFQSIEEFIKKHDSISKLFVKNTGSFTPSMIDKGKWTDYLFFNPEVSRIVTLSNLENELINFELTLKKIEGKSEYIIVFNDITKFISEKNEYLYFAYHDYLTKIYNRQKLDEELIKALEDKKRYKDKLSMLLIDIDYFKNVNDTYGHHIGDLVLIALTQSISKSLRINDIFARWGGEEFIILLPRTDIKTAYLKAQALRKMTQLYISKKIPSITISIGVIEINNSDTIETCLVRVDKALYLAKEKRNDVVQL